MGLELCEGAGHLGVTEAKPFVAQIILIPSLTLTWKPPKALSVREWRVPVN